MDFQALQFLEPWLIPAMILIPLIGGILLLLLPRHELHKICYGTFYTTFVTFLLALTASGVFNWERAGEVQLAFDLNWIPAFGLRLEGGADSLTMWFILLTTFLMPLVMLEAFTHLRQRTGDRAKEFFFWLLFAESAMIAAFCATDLIFFYVCFEFTLIPLFFLIGVYGSTNRKKAAMLYFCYSFTGSMLMLAGILYLAWFNSTLDVSQLIATGALAADTHLSLPQLGQWTFNFNHLKQAAHYMDASQQAVILFALLCGFAVKVPMFPVHTWLPLAHTEAPTAGSVDLAAVMLKLGTYGILRFALQTAPEAVVDYAPLIATLATVGILYTGLVCWVQKDLKKLIAYSSVSHMGFCVLGLFAINNIAIGGSVFYMLSHGLSTGALFLCVGMMYTRFHTRQMTDLSGLGKLMPVWSFFVVFFALCSVGLPGLNGFPGEFLTLMGTFQAPLLGWPFALAAGFGMIVAAIYILYFVGKVVWGPLKIPTDTSHGEIETHDLNIKEIITLAPIAIICLWLGLAPNPVLVTVEQSINPIIVPAERIMQARLDKVQTDIAHGPEASWKQSTLAARVQGGQP